MHKDEYRENKGYKEVKGNTDKQYNNYNKKKYVVEFQQEIRRI